MRHYAAIMNPAPRRIAAPSKTFPQTPAHGIGGADARRLLLSVSEAADALGLRPSAIRAWIYRRRIEVVHVSRAVRIRRSVIDEIIARGTVPALCDREVGR